MKFDRINVNRLDDIGYVIDKEKFFENIQKMAGDAIASGSPGNTRKAITKEDVCTMYRELWE